MSFVPGRGLDAGASPTNANKPNTPPAANPFGLSNFASILDNKFGNSNFSDNLLAKPKGNYQNPFDNNATALSSELQKAKQTPPVENKENNTGHSEQFNNAPTSVFSGFNKGTGLVSGARGRHKLDLCT